MKLSRVLTAVSISFSATFSSVAHADDWGCEVLLCLSNPDGPMAVAQCVPPIKRLYAAIFKWKPDPFPSCDMATSQDGTRSYASVEYNNYYDACPDGTSALPSGNRAVQGTPAQVQEQNTMWQASRPFTKFFDGIGDGNGLSPREDYSLSKKVCVGKYIGTVGVSVGSNNSEDNYRTTYTVDVYDRVAVIDPNLDGNGSVIKVFINDKLYRTVRPNYK
ncbi:hypothetical protein D5041_21365 (plasmid) [Verminephrobacter aporrectodeae subsp. tuberculatae]|nr:hypothetical protein [Verminephrobacter aporrectodeae subsp. tuberculatae]MCW5291476.1 hypothetical protein [Verminephrobacter aporrectodeae subsp. tuberculatae]